MLIARFAVHPSAFALESALTAAPDVTIDADRTAAHSTAFVMPDIWVSEGSIDAFDDALAADPTVEEVVTAESFDDGRFYHVLWADVVNEHVETIIDHEGTILEAGVRNRKWLLRIRFASREQFEQFGESVVEESDAYDLLELTRARGHSREQRGLTTAQRDALVTAVETGYYDVPRETTLAEVADETGISEQAASERLRRGVKSLVTSVLAVDER